jgi:serine/threonine-protein kinase
VAFVGGRRSQIHVRALNGVETTLLADTAGASWRSFSPDGRSISYVDPRELRKVAVDGGPSVKLADVSTEVSPPVQHWRTDDTILFTTKGVLLRVPSTGGTPEKVGPPEGVPYLLPRVRLDGPTVFAFSLPNGPVELNLQRGAMARLQGPGWPRSARECVPEYVPLEPGATTGFRVCYDSQQAAIMAARVDAPRVQGAGELRTVIEGVQPIVGPFGAFAVSESGALAYVAGNFRGIRPSTPVWVDRTGAEEAIPAQERRYESVALSPDGRRIAMQVFDGAAFVGQRDIWV